MFSKLIPLLLLTVNGAFAQSRARAMYHSIARRAHADIQLYKRFSKSRWTFFDVGLGACGGFNVATDFIVALNSVQFGGGYPGRNCFKLITMSYKGKTATAAIMDECPGCPYGGLDLSRGLFRYFADEDIGVIYGDWSFINLAPAAPTTTSKVPVTTIKAPGPMTTTKVPASATTKAPAPLSTTKAHALATSARASTPARLTTIKTASPAITAFSVKSGASVTSTRAAPAKITAIKAAAAPAINATKARVSPEITTTKSQVPHAGNTKVAKAPSPAIANPEGASLVAATTKAETLASDVRSQAKPVAIPTLALTENRPTSMNIWSTSLHTTPATTPSSSAHTTCTAVQSSGSNPSRVVEVNTPAVSTASPSPPSVDCVDTSTFSSLSPAPSSFTSTSVDPAHISGNTTALIQESLQALKVFLARLNDLLISLSAAQEN